jgi:hypothetical protein
MPDPRIQQSLNSTKGISRAQASLFLYGKIMQRIQQPFSEKAYYNSKTITRLALALILLFVINIFTIQRVKIKTPPSFNDQSTVNKLTDEYFGHIQPIPNMY